MLNSSQIRLAEALRNLTRPWIPVTGDVIFGYRGARCFHVHRARPKENNVCVSFSHASLIFTICLPCLRPFFLPLSPIFFFLLLVTRRTSFHFALKILLRFLFFFSFYFFYYHLPRYSCVKWDVKENYLKTRKWRNFLFDCFLAIFYRATRREIIQRYISEEGWFRRQPFLVPVSFAKLFFLTAFYHAVTLNSAPTILLLLCQLFCFSSFLFYYRWHVSFFSIFPPHLRVYNEILLKARKRKKEAKTLEFHWIVNLNSKRFGMSSSQCFVCFRCFDAFTRWIAFVLGINRNCLWLLLTS